MGSRLVRGTVAVAAAVAAAAAAASHAAAADPSEPELKAEFVERFTRFIDWDPKDLPQTLSICVVGDSPISAPLDKIARRQKILNRKARVVPSAPEGVLDCQLVIIGGSDKKRLHAVLGRTEGRPILTIADTPGGAAAGAIINFYIDDKHVKFEINTTAAKDSGLTVRSRLLKLARIISGGKAVP